MSLDDLPRHAALLDGLRLAVRADDRWRWLELSCSLASGRGDELSDIDVGVGYMDVAEDELEDAGLALVHAAGPVADVLVHVLPGWPTTSRRFAVEYAAGVQMDLVLVPAERRTGLPTGATAVVDKDDRLTRPWTPPVELPPSGREAREWVLAGWWAISDATKYVRRGTLFEAAERLVEARQHALRLFATARRVPFPSFGLVSLLDFPPFELPDGLATTYCVPDDRAAVVDAVTAVAELLTASARMAAETLGIDLSTPFEAIARERLAAATADDR